ncbi:leucine-rich repeat domain-containing protein [Paenibacillus ginsengarvi]|uniref:SMI1/KNR4 family protein n=1 Tax=Paenibacillus ginsengarvi TaxID=400777 RepID=A0A3B0CIX1_9BACL|nr:leucine-rich repeat domain-containing protein [Paenibacillus ginsengarvi]RKN84247.1 SMI1/KNR4 family protein [Paenibacillus ginsengarvi]
MRKSIQEIIDKLREELPELAESLNPPVTEAELRLAEEELGFALPAELRELYQIHNGEKEEGTGFFFGMPFLSLSEMLSEWNVWAELEEGYAVESGHHSVPAGWIKERYINRYWLPISKDWGGNNIGVDLDPDANGVKGQVINFGRDEEIKYVIARNLTCFLQFIRDTAKAGSYNIVQEEEYRTWSLGRDGAVHFLDAIRNLELPVLEARQAQPGAADVQIWYEGLDDEWRQRIESAFGSPERFVRAKQLRFIREGLTHITPLERCEDVRELVLSANEIRSIEALSGCKQLKQLYLGKNPVTDLSPLQHLEHLQELIITGTTVTDLSPLSALPKLKELDAQQTPVRDLSPLKPIKSLRTLKISKPDAKQLRSLAELNQLRELTISGLDSVTEAELAAIGKLVHLRKVELEGVSLSNLEFLKGCVKLEELEMNDTAVRDMSAVAGLEHLHTLKMSGCPDVGNLEQVARSASLNKMMVSFQQFMLLKDRFDRMIDFSTMSGTMTDEESDIWHEYVDRARR